jgi:hypothetical protein
MVNHDVVSRLELVAELHRYIRKDRTLKGREGAPREIHPIDAVAAIHLLIRAQAHESASGQGPGKGRLARTGEAGHEDAERRT